MEKPFLTAVDFQRAADQLGCSVAAIKAVCAIEAPRGGFLQSGKPTILFERHIFSRLTGRKFDAAHPDISNPKAGGYLGGEREHDRLEKAMALDRNAALQSASWGRFQIMGFNAAAAGFKTLQAFINAMHAGEPEQLDAFVNFIKTNKLDDELRELRWADFARKFNGPAYQINKYDSKLAVAYKQIESQG